MKNVLGNKVLVELNTESLEKTESGLFIPKKSKRYKEGKVLKFPKKFEELNEGDVVYLMPTVGKSYTKDNKDYAVVHVSEIILIK